MELLLGSKSPRRKELLLSLEFDFKVVHINVEESFPNSLKAMDVAKYLAVKKANAYKGLKPSQVLLTADTTVVVGDTILNKPQSREDAVVMLKALSNKTHAVITGFCLKSLEKQLETEVTTNVTFGNLNPKQIDHYLETYQPFDKAGAYGIQEWIGHVGVSSLEGSYTNVVGLPTFEVYHLLKTEFNFGI
jgi:septum formation protein